MINNNYEDEEDVLNLPFVPNIVDADEFQKIKRQQTLKYDKFKRPFDLQEALNHGRAQRVCKEICPLQINTVQSIGSDQSKAKNHYKDENKCPCCGFQIENEQLPLNCHYEDFLHLGITYPLYFYYIRYCIILLSVQFILCSLPALIINIRGHSCNDSDNFICTLSFLNIMKIEEHKSLSTENIQNIFFLAISFIMIAMFKIHVKRKENKYTTERILISDFSLSIQNIPQNTSHESLQEFLQERYNQYVLNINHQYSKSYQSLKDSLMQNMQSQNNLQQNIKFVKWYFLYDLNKYGEIYEEYKRLIEKNEKNDFKRIENLKKQLIQFEQKYISYQQSNESSNQLQFSTKALVTFSSAVQTQQIKRIFKMNKREKFYCYFSFLFPSKAQQILSRFTFQNKIIKIKKAPEPSDILWYNIGSTHKKTRQIVISYITVYLLMVSTFIVLLLIKKIIKNTQKQQNQYVSLLLSFTVSTIVCLFNSLMGIVIRKGTKYEEHDVQTNFFISVATKLTNMFILNMVLSTFMSNVVHYFTFGIKNKTFPLDAQGLMGDFFFLFITNSYMGSIFNIFDIVWGYRLFKRYQAKKDPNKLTQQQANQLFEGHPIDMALRYANINKTVLFTAAVSPFIPVGVPLSIIGLIISYWVDKYLLLRRYVCKNYLSFKLAKKMVINLKLYSVYFAFGNLVSMMMPVMQENENKIKQYQWSGSEKHAYFYLMILGFWISMFVRYLPFSGIYTLYSFILRDKFIKKKKITESYESIQDLLKDDYHKYQPIQNNCFEDNQESRSSSVVTNRNETNRNLTYQQLFQAIQKQIDFDNYKQE